MRCCRRCRHIEVTQYGLFNDQWRSISGWMSQIPSQQNPKRLLRCSQSQRLVSLVQCWLVSPGQSFLCELRSLTERDCGLFAVTHWQSRHLNGVCVCVPETSWPHYRTTSSHTHTRSDTADSVRTLIFNCTFGLFWLLVSVWQLISEAVEASAHLLSSEQLTHSGRDELWKVSELLAAKEQEAVFLNVSSTKSWWHSKNFLEFWGRLDSMLVIIQVIHKVFQFWSSWC